MTFEMMFSDNAIARLKLRIHEVWAQESVEDMQRGIDNYAKWLSTCDNDWYREYWIRAKAALEEEIEKRQATIALCEPKEQDV